MPVTCAVAIVALSMAACIAAAVEPEATSTRWLSAYSVNLSSLLRRYS